MRVSNKSRYGLRAMVYLAKSKKMCSLREISEDENIPFDYLEKIFSKLEKKGLIKSKRGAQGGYFLADKPKNISAGQIIKILEGAVTAAFCITKNKGKRCSCSRAKKCLTKNVWQKITDNLNSTLNSITLENLVNKKI